MADTTRERDVFVITGGACGMGYATAEILSKRNNTTLLLTGRNPEHLEHAEERLKAQKAHVRIAIETCDVANPDDVLHLADTASRLGTVRGVVHTAGLSPNMGDYKQIIAVNALGTLYVDRAFMTIACEDFTMVNVSSLAAHILPKAMLPTHVYQSVKIGPHALGRKLEARCRLLPKNLRSSIAYPISKNFVNWYTRHLAGAYGTRGAHIISVSPGSFDTTMGELEKDSGAGALANLAAIKRFGEPHEVGELLAWLVTDSPVYLTGTDILIDGGAMAKMNLTNMLAMSKSAGK